MVVSFPLHFPFFPEQTFVIPSMYPSIIRHCSSPNVRNPIGPSNIHRLNLTHFTMNALWPSFAHLFMISGANTQNLSWFSSIYPSIIHFYTIRYLCEFTTKYWMTVNWFLSFGILIFIHQYKSKHQGLRLSILSLMGGAHLNRSRLVFHFSQLLPLDLRFNLLLMFSLNGIRSPNNWRGRRIARIQGLDFPEDLWTDLGSSPVTKKKQVDLLFNLTHCLLGLEQGSDGSFFRIYQ